MSEMPYRVTHDQEEGYCYVKGPGVFEAFSDDEPHTASTVAKHLNAAYLAGRAEGKAEGEERVRELEEALNKIGAYGDGAICPYGCDCPHIAKAALSRSGGRG